MISFISVFPPYRGGISNYSDYLYRHLQQRTPVYPVNFRKLYPGLLFPGKTQFMEVPVEEYAERKLHSYAPFNWFRTGNEITAREPDVLLFSYWHPFFIPAFKRIIKQVRKRRPEVRVYTIAHNVTPHEGFPFAKPLMSSFFNLNDQVVVLSGQTEKEYHKLGCAAPVSRIFHPVYDRKAPEESKEILRRRYGFEEDDRIPLFFGLIRDYKGLDVLIRSLNQLDLNKLRIRPLIAGEFYTNKAPYLDLIREEHKERYTIIDRFVSPREADEIFSLSDVLVLPYKTASQSGVFNDALNFQLPSIVSDHPGLTEYLDHGENGLIFESENTEQLSGLLHDILTDTAMRGEISDHLTELKSELSWDRFTDRLLSDMEIKPRNHLPKK